MATPVRACVVLTGDELLRGFVQDANSGHLARRLRQLGIDLVLLRFVADGLDSIAEALTAAREAAGAGGLVVVGGGLGPTHDDRTTEAVARVAGRGLVLDETALATIESRVRALGRMRTHEEVEAFTPGNRKQATLPEGALALEPAGTAPGYVVTSADGDTTFVVLPGPPGELRHAWKQAEQAPAVAARVAAAPPRHERVVRVWGRAESIASAELERLGHVDSPAVTVTLCARDGELELSVRGTDTAGVDGLVDGLRGAFGDAVFALDDEQPVERMVGHRLRERGLTLATAESCTGGMLGELVTSVPGSSEWYRGGVVAYHNDVKAALVGVDEATLATHGAVSEAVARELADGVRQRLGADLGVGITGVAGPGGGSEEKPVGTVFVALAGADGCEVLHLRIPGDRTGVRRRSCLQALHLVRRHL